MAPNEAQARRPRPPTRPAMALALLLVVTTGAHAQPARGARGDAPGLGAVEMRSGAIAATGLVPVFPATQRCEPISSPYGSDTRYDGSRRRMDRNEGLHGGMDLSLKEGTPLLAVAAGEVAATGEGGRLEGLFIWLRHSPQDSGLPFFVFSKYQHLQQPSSLKPGDRVRAGEVVGLSGKTGTVGGHYGAAGYPHLHLTTRYGPVGEFEMRGNAQSMLGATGSVSGDPMHLYRSDLVDLHVLGQLPAAREIAVAVVQADGSVFPPGARRVWPVACTAR